jgi:hypothetical protein
MCCSRCDADTPNGATFCIECGTPLRARCPQCGADARPQAKFWGASDTPLGGTPAAPPPAHAQPPVNFTPGHLVETLLTSKAALEGERKQVTVALSPIWPCAWNRGRCRGRSSSRLRRDGWEGHLQVNALGPVPIEGLHTSVEIFGDRLEGAWVRTRQSIQAPMWG